MMEKGGLQKTEDGGMTLGGKPFNGFGVNCFNLISQCVGKDGSDPALAEKTLETLAKYHVKAVRFSVGGFYRDGWDDVRLHSEKWYKVYDAAYKKAEEMGIGLIPSFFWTPMFCDMFDEPMGTATSDPEHNPSKTLAFMKKYTLDFVNRYKESPAAFLWEYGNEHNLDMDIPWFGFRALPEGSKRTRRTQWEDMETSKNHAALLSWWGKLVKEADPYKRIVGTGDAVARPCGYHQAFFNQSMQPDTEAEHTEYMRLMHPDGIDAISVHEYTSYGFIRTEYGADPKAQPGLLGGLTGTETWDTSMQKLKGYAAATGKTCYVGEYGIGTGAPFNKEEYETQFRAIMDAVVKNKVPLAMFWNYDFNTNEIPGDLTEHGTGVEYSCNERWEKGKLILGLIKEYNDNCGA